MHSANMANTQAAAPFNFVNNPMQHMPHMGNRRLVRFQVPAGYIQTMPTNQGIVGIRLPASYAHLLQNAQGTVRLRLPAANGQTQQGSSSNSVVESFRNSAPP